MITWRSQASDDELKNELPTAMKDSTRLSQLVDDVLAGAVDLRERLGAKDGIIQSIVKDWCASLGPSLKSSDGNFREGLNRSENEAFLTGSIASQFHHDTAVDAITVRFFGRCCVGRW